MKRRTERDNLSKLCHPTSERKCPLFKGELRASVQVCDKNAHSTVGAGLGSLSTLASHLQSWMSWLTGLLLWWSERDKRLN
jgi:hypothetical protein